MVRGFWHRTNIIIDSCRSHSYFKRIRHHQVVNAQPAQRFALKASTSIIKPAEEMAFLWTAFPEAIVVAQIAQGLKPCTLFR